MTVHLVGRSLNPCFNGNRFGSDKRVHYVYDWNNVLILVLVEIGLGGLKFLISP